MTLSIISNPHISSLYTLTGSQTADLAKIPDLLTHFTQHGAIPEKNRPQLSNRHIVNLSDRLQQLRNSVIEYSKLCFFWKIIGIFSGTFWNYQRLQRTLPFIINQVDALVLKIMPKTPPPPNGSVAPGRVNQPPQVVNAPVTPSPSKPTVQPHVYPSPPPAAAKQPAKPPVAPVTPSKPQAQPYSPPTPPTPPSPQTPAIVPKLPRSVAERIARKITLLNRAIELLNEQLQGHRGQILRDPSKLDPDIKAALKAEDFFQKAKEKLANGYDAPLPRWYHATSDKIIDPLTNKPVWNHALNKCEWQPPGKDYNAVTKIIRAQELVQSPAPTGLGVYLSSCDETAMYGPWTFAIDESVLADTEGHFFPAEKTNKHTRMHPAMWVRVLSNIPINTDSVAFMIASAERVDDLRQKVLTPTNFKVDVLSREEANQIYFYLEMADTVRLCPSNRWTPHYADPCNRVHHYEAPDNMKNRSWPRFK